MIFVQFLVCRCPSLGPSVADIWPAISDDCGRTMTRMRIATAKNDTAAAAAAAAAARTTTAKSTFLCTIVVCVCYCCYLQ
jgi:hypothetical protein